MMNQSTSQSRYEKLQRELEPKLVSKFSELMCCYAISSAESDLLSGVVKKNVYLGLWVGVFGKCCHLVISLQFLYVKRFRRAQCIVVVVAGHWDESGYGMGTPGQERTRWLGHQRRYSGFGAILERQTSLKCYGCWKGQEWSTLKRSTWVNLAGISEKVELLFFFFISIPFFPPTHFNSIELPGSSPCSHLPVHLLCRWQHQVRQQGQGKRDGQGSQRHTPQAGGDWWRSRVTHQLGDAQYLNCGGGRRSPSTANTQSEEHLVNIHACACSYPHQSFTLNHFPGHLHKSENKITAVWSNIRPFFSLFQEALWKIIYLICFLWQDI